MANGLKVLMMGGKRVGKSSALAAIIDAFITGGGKDIIIAKDITVLESVNGQKQASIDSKLQDIKDMLNRCNGKTVMFDSGKTSNKWDYNLELTLAGTRDSMMITFTDVNGEFFEGGNRYQTEVINLVKTYDVFVIAVDTPFLMEARNSDATLVSSAINKKYNCIESIHTFLAQINDDDGQDAKLVIFVPIKCEYWARKNQLDAVVEAIVDDYKTPINALRKYKSVQIEILPIQTIGSALFCEHLDAYTCHWTERRFIFFNKDCFSKCGILPSGEIRLANGTIKQKESIINIQDDIDAILIPDTDIVRPNSWFAIESKEYKPHNCEQLALHILDFMLAKVTDVLKREEANRNPILRGLMDFGNFVLNIGTLGLWDKLRDVFGEISVKQMQTAISQMREKELIKYSGEGITILEKCDFND